MKTGEAKEQQETENRDEWKDCEKKILNEIQGIIFASLKDG